MMRSRWRSLAWLTVCGLLVLVAAAAGASRAARGTKTAVRAGHARPLTRTWSTLLSPHANDLVLVEIGFPKARRGVSISARTLRVAASAPFGDDYVAIATPTARTPDDPRALVVLVNRPSPLMDPVDVRLRVTARRALGTPVVWKLANAFSQPRAGLTPALCDLPVHGPTLTGADLLALGSQGAALAGFGVTSAVAQAYDVGCGLPYTSAFQQDVTHGGASAQPPLPQPSPAPQPPAPAPPPAPTPEQLREGMIPGEECRREDRPGVACPARAVR